MHLLIFTALNEVFSLTDSYEIKAYIIKYRAVSFEKSIPLSKPQELLSEILVLPGWYRVIASRTVVDVVTYLYTNLFKFMLFVEYGLRTNSFEEIIFSVR